MPSERKEMTEAIKAELEMGLISRLDAIRMLNPAIESDEDALERLLRTDAIQAQLMATEDTMTQTPDIEA
jgi:hypothetical protein